MTKLRDIDAKARALNPLGRDFSEALARGIAIMSVFGTGSGAMRLTDIAAKVGLPRATVRRALLTLVQLGYAFEANRLFSLTPKVLGLARSYLGTPATILQPRCAVLAGDYGLTCSVATLDGEDIVLEASAAPGPMARDMPGIGSRAPAFCTASGRVLVAGLPAERRRQFLDHLEPVAQTPHTVTAKSSLSLIFSQIEREGYCLTEEEATLGVRSLAVPLRDGLGNTLYALNFDLPADRSNADMMRGDHLPRLQAEALVLEEVLAGR